MCGALLFWGILTDWNMSMRWMVWRSRIPMERGLPARNIGEVWSAWENRCAPRWRERMGPMTGRKTGFRRSLMRNALSTASIQGDLQNIRPQEWSRQRGEPLQVLWTRSHILRSWESPPWRSCLLWNLRRSSCLSVGTAPLGRKSRTAG